MPRTFREIAERASELVPIIAAQGGVAGVREDMMLLAELANGLDRLEYNTAVQIAMKGFNTYDYATLLDQIDDIKKNLIRNMVELLREEVPEEAMS